ncbi:RsmD family RNA methyltransferase, partial [Planctomycetota bacterium]
GNTKSKKYDLVFIDPPYIQAQDVQDGSKLAGLMDLLSEQVNENGVIVVRTSSNVELLNKYGKFEIVERRKWGTMAVTILR